MKKITYVLIPLLSVLLMIASCGKDGSTGPKGDTGATGTAGVVGPAGPTGTNGQNGSVIYSGEGAPNAATGATGDFYLNSNNGLLYGPKTAAGWGAGFSLKGANGNAGTNGTDGLNGAAGSQILTGAEIPTADLGNSGDYYLNKTTYLLYGPKADGGWGVAVSLQGPAGTANVKYSGWAYAVRFVDSTFDNSSIKVGHLPAPALDADFTNTGTALVYFTYGAGVFNLPYTSNAGGKPNTITFFPKPKEFVVYRFTHDNSNSVALSTLLQYRYVLIPGGVKLAKANGINLNDYGAVKRFYRIAD